MSSVSSATSASILTPTKNGSRYVIRHPEETESSHPVTTQIDAKKILGTTSDAAINMAKMYLRGVDLTSISTRDLTKLGQKLYDAKLISEGVLAQFKSGSMEYNFSGKQTNLDSKFNAIAMFNQKLEDREAYVTSHPGKATGKDFKQATKNIEDMNHVIAALSYFSTSKRSNLSISEYV